MWSRFGGNWLVVDALASAIMAVFCTMALLDYWPPSPYGLIIGVGFAFADVWWLGLGAIWVRNTLQARRRPNTNGDVPPT